MGYFSEMDMEDQSYKRKSSSKKSTQSVGLAKEQLINQMVLNFNQKREELENLSSKDLQKRFDLLSQKRYLKQYGNSERARLYEYQDDEREEKNGFGL